MHDPLSDMLTRLRNALKARKAKCVVPASRLIQSVLDVLKREGYLESYVRKTERAGVDIIEVDMPYHRDMPRIYKMWRVSTPGRRVYRGVAEIPVINNGLGIVVLSTARGVLSSNEAIEKNVGGEVLCAIS